MKTTRALDLPPELNSTEWVWLFQAVLEHFAEGLRRSVRDEMQTEAEIRALGQSIPFNGRTEIDPEKRRQDRDRFRASYRRIMDMARYLLAQAEKQSAEEFASAMSGLFDNAKPRKGRL